MKIIATVMGIMIGFVNLVILPHFNETNLQELWNPNGYCDIEKCKIITCSNISDVSVIIPNFKIECPHERQISLLKFENCRFSGGMTIEFSIINLIFEECLFDTDIDENSFSSSAVESTKYVEIINGSVRKLTKGIFKKFHNLLGLTIRDTIIEEAEFNLLEYVADVLQIIELDRSIRNDKVVKNITSGSQLSKVELLSLQGNNISHLSSEILGNFPNILSIYLDSSKIKYIDVDAFKSLKSVKQIFLNNNFLTTIDENIFNAIVLINPNIRIMMMDNPWNCNCKLQWIQKLIDKKPNLFGIVPKCETPERNYGLDFSRADFCDLTNNSESLVDMKNCENDKLITIIIIISVTSIFFITGSILTFFIILRHPQLIRASPRVILVKRGNIDAMILPKGVLWREGDDKLNTDTRPEYLTPISRKTNLIFQGNYYDSISKISSHSNLIKKLSSDSYDVPPPLPPHPKFGISTAVDEPQCPDFLESGVYFL